MQLPRKKRPEGVRKLKKDEKLSSFRRSSNEKQTRFVQRLCLDLATTPFLAQILKTKIDIRNCDVSRIVI